MTDRFGPQPSFDQAARTACVWSLLLKNRLAATGFFLLVMLSLVILLVPFLPIPDPSATAPSERLKPLLTKGHLLGTDQLGRDLLSRVLWGSRVSFVAGCTATVLAATAGSLVGLACGYIGGQTDNIIMRGIDMLMAFPYILLALAIVAALGPSLVNALYAVAIVNIPFFARNVRGATRAVAHLAFIDAARLSGKGTLSILFTELLPNVLPVIVTAISTTAGWMILETAGLSFLGLGAQPPQADLGSMLGQGRAQIFNAPHVTIVPGIMIFLIVVCLNVLGDGIRDMLDPRLKAGALLRPGPMTEVAATRWAPVRQNVNAVLSLEDLEIGFSQGSHFQSAVKGVSLHLVPGECLGLVGESGSGKSVTGLSIMRLVNSPTGIIRNGAIYLHDEDVLAMPQNALIGCRGKRVSYIFQDPLTTLHPLVKIGRQVEGAIAAHQSLGRAALREMAASLLEQVEIPNARDRMDDFPHQLSGGQRQRVGIAMALANDPEIIIADEPTTALDVTVQAHILALLRRVQRDRRMALLFISHDFGVVSAVCDRVAVMRQGEILETGQTQHVLAHPQHPYTRQLIACVPRMGDGHAFLARIAPLFPLHRAEATA